MKKKIKNIIFDIGNVLFTYNPEHIITSLLPKTPHKDLYLNELFHSNDWQQLDRGDLSLPRLVSQLTDRLALTASQQNDIERLVTCFPDHLILNTDMKNVFLHFCNTHKVYILSNFQSKPFERLKTNHPFLTKATGTLISANVRMKKPEIGIFHYLLTQQRILPEECLFIDDMADNINTAQKLQLHTLHHKNGTDTIHTLSKQGIL